MKFRPALDWVAIRKHYVGTNLSLADISRRHGVAISTIRSHARREGWPERQERRPKPRGSVLHRLRAAIERKLEHMEKRLDSETEDGAAASERTAREIGALARSYEKVEALIEASHGARSGSGKRSETAAIRVEDVEQWRDALAERIARLRAQYRLGSDGD
jgi:lambda repressor-like predicted transcriptional regulator